MAAGLTVLGCCGAWPEPGAACSGFVLDAGGAALVLDLGWGTFSRLPGTLLADDRLAGVVVTHEHPDHMADLGALVRSRWFGPARGRLPLVAPRGVVDRLVAGEPDGAEVVDQVLDWRPPPTGPLPLGPFTVTTAMTPHFVPNAAVRVEVEGFALAYTGDSGPCEALDRLATGADLLLAEASDRRQQASTPAPPAGERLHLDAGDAGRLAARAGVRRLVLTHFWPGNDRERTRRDASVAWGGEAEVAVEDVRLELT